MDGVLNGLPPTNRGWNEKMKRWRKSLKNRFTKVVTGTKAPSFSTVGMKRIMDAMVSKGFDPSRSAMMAS